MILALRSLAAAKLEARRRLEMKFMMPRHKRMALVGGIVLGVGVAAWLGALAFQANVNLFFQPTDISAGKANEGAVVRLGGMVQKGSIQRAAGSLDVKFLVTDFKHTVPVTYSGVLPDLFRDGQGVVARGRMQNGVFVADEILAKHDEKYMPPQVAEVAQEQSTAARSAAVRNLNMIPELGQFALVLALLLAAAQAVFGLVGRA